MVRAGGAPLPFVALAFFAPALPVIILGGFSEDLAALSLLVLIVAQDSILMGAALVFSWPRCARVPGTTACGPRPLADHCWAALGFAVLFGFEVGYIELFDVNETNVEDLGDDSLVAASLVAIAVIVVAPISEEFFFRAFFYRALRTRLPVWLAAPIDGVVFGALHFEGVDTAIILPVIAVFGVGLCLIYERTGSLFAVIAIHAAFNTVATLGTAPVPALVLGALVLTGCLLAPRRFPEAPAPMKA